MSSLSPSPLVSVRPRFHRSVNVVEDWKAPENIQTYHVTQMVRDLTTRIAEDLAATTGTRAWSITGPYGSGKSAFALFLADLLGRNVPLHTESLAITNAVSMPLPRLLPVLVTGRRTPLVPALRSALIEACKAERVSLGTRDRGTGDEASAFGRLLDRAGRLVAQKTGFDGVMLLIDELGKFLEYASLHPETDDVFILQHIAEVASRSPRRLLAVTILHTGFTDYLGPANRSRLAEWQKIQGRFTDVTFQLPVEEVLTLTAIALETSWPIHLRAAYTDLVREVWHAPSLSEVRQRLQLSKQLMGCAPLHPITAIMLWPLFQSKLAQNERSLFAFLTSHEFHGLQEYLKRADWDGHDLPVYRLSHLYDYVNEALA